MIHDENYFKTLTALAVAGQVSQAELVELQQHAAGCSPCTERIAEIEAASIHLFAFLASRSQAASTPAGMQERFWVCATKAAVPLTRPPSGLTVANALRLASALVLIAILSLGWKTLSEKSSAETRSTASSREANIPEPASRAIPVLERQEEVTVSHPAITGPLKSRVKQVRTERITSTLPQGEHFHEMPLFALNPAILLSTHGIPNRFHPLGGGNLIAAIALSQQPGISPPYPRVFHYNATVAVLSFLDNPPDFKLTGMAPDFSLYGSANAARSR